MEGWLPKSYSGDLLAHYWIYKDLEQKTIGATARYENEAGDKVVIPFFKGDSAPFQVGKMPGLTPLYGLEQIVKRNYCTPVFIPEGEKCRDALHQLGFLTLSWQGGCKAVSKSDWSILADFLCFYLLPDNDEQGEKAMDQVIIELTKVCKSPEIYRVNLPELPEKGDIIDFIQKSYPEWDGYSDFSLEQLDNLSRVVKEAIADHSKKIDSKLHKGRNDISKNRNDYVPISLSEFMSRDVAKRPAMFGDWLLEGAPMLISGASGCGKSLMVYTLAIALASGGEAFGWQANGCYSIGIVDGEMFDETIQRRLGHIILGFDREFDTDQIKILSRDLCRNMEARFPDLKDVNERKTLLDHFIGFDVVIFDNINSLFPGGDERSTIFWNAVEELVFDCRERNIAPILVHHTTTTTPDKPAGSSKNVRVPEVSIVLTPIDSDHNGAHFNIQFSKLREQTEQQEQRSAKAICLDDGCLIWEISNFMSAASLNPQMVKAAELRNQGKTYREIETQVGIPKSTLQIHLKDIDTTSTPALPLIDKVSNCPDTYPQDNGTE